MSIETLMGALEGISFKYPSSRMAIDIGNPRAISLLIILGEKLPVWKK